MELREKLKKRLKDKTDIEIDHILHIVDKYSLPMTIRNFDSNGLVLFDDRNHTVRVVEGNLTDSSIHIKNPKSDVVIIYCDGLLAGWCNSDKMSDLTDRMSIDRQSLTAMPDTFRFIQGCAHLSEHGGFYDGEYWECANCGERLVFKEDG